MRTAPTELMEKVAAELGGGWSVVKDGHSPFYCTLAAPGGWVFLSASIPYGDAERVEVSVDFHAAGLSSGRISYSTLPGRIRMSMRRGPAALAADIRRRILPDAESFFAVAYQEFADWRDHLAQVNHDVALLVEMSRGGLRPPRHDDPSSSDRSLWADQSILGCSGYFRVIGSSVEIKLSSVDVPTATALLELLTTLHSQKPT